MKPPDDVFCMQCGPSVALVPESSSLLRCPHCGSSRRVPGSPLFVVTGPSGVGKSALVEPLAERLPTCLVFDVDTILHVAALGWDNYRNTWLQLADAIAVNGFATVLCGTLLPEQLSSLPGRRLVGPMHFCRLECPDSVLSARLRARPLWRGARRAEFLAEQAALTARLRATVRPAFDSARRAPAEVADDVADWISSILVGR